MCTHLIKRGSRYFFRRRVPSDLVSVIGSKEFTKALGTSDRAEAITRCRLEGVRLDAEWSALRAAAQAKDAIDSASAAAQASARKVQSIPAADLPLPTGPTGILAYDLEEDPYAAEALDFIRTAEDEGLDGDAAWGEELAIQQRMHIEREAKRRLRAEEAATQQTAYQVTENPQLLPSHPVKTLRDVVPSWIARNAPKENAIGRTSKALSLFEQAVGVIPLAALKKSDGAAFVLFLLDRNARGFGRKTAHNHAACITALLTVAVKDDLIERNPLDLTFDKSIGAEKREPWTDVELSRMFGHALFSERMSDVPEWQDVKPADGRALLLILQHTGARIGEIAQLRRGDFQVLGGTTAIRITAEAGTVKTAESERTIPFAAHLLADKWFGAWLASVMDGSRAGDPAFPSMAGRARGPGDTAVQWFREFRADASLPAGALNGSHRFRHWIRSALAAKNIGDATADAITGHAAQGSSGRVAYTTIPLAVMLDALNALKYPNVSGEG